MKKPFQKILQTAFVLYLLTLMFLVHKLYDVEVARDNAIHEAKMSAYNTADSRPGSTMVITDEDLDILANLLDTEPVEPRTVLKYGPGEYGKAVKLGGVNLTIPLLMARDEKHRFNTFLSDMVSLQRTLPDMRPTLCKLKTYPDDMPPASVVIIYRDELASILLRTVYSVLQMSPPNLIKEIILVDDGSLDWDLRFAVGIHVAALEKVRVVRHETSRGLMSARQSGIMATTSDYFIVMDGHMEVGPGWLEPLLYRLIQEPKALLCSHVGGIDKGTFEFKIGNGNPDDTRAFTQVFPFFDHITMAELWTEFSETFRNSRNGSVEPVPYGMLQGMMVVMKKDFYVQLGGFDPGMQVWGSEQIEFSVKAWMCGGRIEMIPCSTVGHMFRTTPWGKVVKDNDFHSVNKARMVKVWMDPPYNEHINYFLSDKSYTEGDLSDRHSIRRRNQCKPYQYFIDNVKTFSDTYLDTDQLHKGNVINTLTDRCLDIMRTGDRKYKLGLQPCHGPDAGNQYLLHTKSGMIRSVHGTIVLAHLAPDGAGVVLGVTSLPEERAESHMKWNMDRNKQLINEKTGTCLTVAGEDLIMANCGARPEQTWLWKIREFDVPQKEEDAPQMIDGDPQVVNGDPQMLNGAPQLLNGDPQMLNGDPQVLNGAPQLLNGDPQLLNVDPQLLNGDPQLLNGAPQLLNGDPQLLNGDPQLLNGAPQLLNGDPQLLNGDPQLLNGAPQLLNGDPPLLNGDPQVLNGAPQLLNGAPQMFNGAPQMLNHYPRMLNGNPQMLNGNPQMLNGYPLMLNGNPQMLNGNPQMLNGNPQMLNGNPQMLNGYPLMLNGDQQLLNGDPQMLNGNPQMLNGNPQMLNGDPQMLNGDQQLLNGVPQMLNDDQRMLNGDPWMLNGAQQMLNGNPQMLNGNPLMLNGDPLMLNGNPLMLNGNPQILNGDPQLLNGDPQILNGDPQMLNGDPQMLNGNPQILNGNPQILNGDPQILNGNPQILNGDPQILNGNPQILNGNPQMLNGDPQILHYVPQLRNGAQQIPNEVPQLRRN